MHEECLREWMRHGHDHCEICHEKFTIAKDNSKPAITCIVLLIFGLLHILFLCSAFIIVRPLSSVFPSFSFLYCVGTGLVCNCNGVYFENALIILLLPAAAVYIVLDWHNWIGVCIQIVYVAFLPLLYAVLWKARRVNSLR